MKIILQAFLLSSLLISCNQPDPPLKKQNHLDFTVSSIPREPAKREEVKNHEMVKNETRFYTNLSSQFNFRLTVFNNESNYDPAGSVLKVYSKTGDFIQKIELSNQLMGPMDLREVSSFETKVKHPSIQGGDNMYGTLIIEDFNFDGLYDIALMEGCYNNGNSRYCYYLQSEDSLFVKNNFLSNKLETYPAKRDALKNQLTSSLISYNSCRKTTVQYNDSLKTWKKIKEVIYE